MPQRPDDELTPGLQSPTEAAAQRAKPIFDRLVGEMRAQRAASAAPSGEPGTAPPTGAAQVPRGAEFGGGRRYDVALSMVAGLANKAAPPAAAAPSPARQPVSMPENEEPTRVAPLNSISEPTVIGERPPEQTRTQVRPPPGAPTVRQGAKRPARTQASTEEMLQSAESAMLRTESDGTMAFDIVFRDDVFSDLVCTISVNNGRATAVFRVGDDNTRRLLEGEVGRLRAGLEDRGLKVEEVKVIVQPPYPSGDA